MVGLSAALISAALICMPAASPVHVGRGTVFALSKRDRHNRGRFACLAPRRSLLQTTASRRLVRAGHLVAHPSLPCWSTVRVCDLRTNRCASATVADRGPRRAAIDLWFRLARHMKFSGSGPVAFIEEAR